MPIHSALRTAIVVPRRTIGFLITLAIGLLVILAMLLARSSQTRGRRGTFTGSVCPVPAALPLTQIWC